MIKVAVDAMGGDNAPGEIVAGAVEAVREKSGIQVALIGREELVKAELAKYKMCIRDRNYHSPLFLKRNTSSRRSFAAASAPFSVGR